MDEIQKAYNLESIKRKRLTCDKEELQYHLKQRSEQLILVQGQLQEWSNSSQDNSLSHHNTTYNRSHSMRASLEANSTSLNTSPPASPVIKGVIERNDSVSYVLDMDDETPQVAASKLVRRAGSLRNTSERSLTQRRQLSMSASNGHGNGHSTGPNPLSQSMSATTLIRGSSQVNEPESPRPLYRARSQTVCNNKERTSEHPKGQLQRQRSAAAAGCGRNSPGARTHMPHASRRPLIARRRRWNASRS